MDTYLGAIYCIVNNLNGKKYIGKTKYTDPYKRWAEHISEVKKDRLTYRKPLYDAMRKYGIHNFTFSIVESIYGIDESILESAEVNYIKVYNTYSDGYNATLGGEGKSLYTDAEILEALKAANNDCNLAADYLECHYTTVNRVAEKHAIVNTAIMNRYNYGTNIPLVMSDKSFGIPMMIFSSIHVASVYLKKEDERFQNVYRHITLQLKGERKTVRGFRFRKATDEEAKRFTEIVHKHLTETREMITQIEYDRIR